jgi:carbon monoxide dehydrogenase subunit G
MQLRHDFTVPAPVDETWATFMDLRRVGGCFPGAVVTDASDDGFSGTVKVKLGPIALQYAGTGAFLERDDSAHRAVIEAKGKDKRGNGTAGATVTVELAPAGEGTRVEVSTDLSITGKPAQFGRGVMQDVSDKLLQQFVACIERQFEAPGVEDGGAGTPTASPSAGVPDVGGAVPDAAQAAPDAAGAVLDAVAAAAATAAGSEGPPPTEAAAVAPGGPASGPGPTAPPQPPRPAAPRPLRPAPAPAADDSIDLGATVLPVLLRSYAPYAVVGLLGLVLGWLFGRRRS